jgi:hypothetical protein
MTNAVPWLRWLVAGLSLRRPGFDPGSVHVGFVVFPLSILFHRCSITWKNEKTYHLSSHIQYRVAQKGLRLRCVGSFCCGALLKKNNKTSIVPYKQNILNTKKNTDYYYYYYYYYMKRL